MDDAFLWGVLGGAVLGVSIAVLLIILLDKR
jgi:hypothetical protein